MVTEGHLNGDGGTHYHLSIQAIIIYIYIGECVCVCLCVYPSGRIHVAACSPIGTKFGTLMQIHIEMVMGEIKITPCTLGAFGGF